MARNRKRAKERQARRKAQDADPNAAKPGPTRRRGGDPIVDDVLDELERESVVPVGQDSPTPPPLSESERLRSGEASESFDPDALEDQIDSREGESFDSAEDLPEEDLAKGGSSRERDEKHAHRPRLVQFLIAVWAELQRVQWPDRQAMVTLTGVVLGFVLVAGGYLGLLDAIVSRAIQAIL